MNVSKIILAVLVIGSIVGAGCANPATERQERVVELRNEIKQAVGTPCALHSAEHLSNDPASWLFDRDPNEILEVMRWHRAFEQYRQEALDLHNEILRIVYDLDSFEERLEWYNHSLALCKQKLDEIYL